VLVHRPDDDPERLDRFLGALELGEEGGIDLRRVLVAREAVVAEALDGTVEGDGEVGDRFLVVREQLQQARDEADGGLDVVAGGVGAARTLGEVRTEQLVGAIDEV
jgi:hypothetical protein